MWEFLKKNITTIVKLAVLIIIFSLFSYIFQIFFFRLDQQQIKEWLRAFGVQAPLIYIVLMVIAEIFLPIPDFVIFIGAGLLFPWHITLITTLIADFISATISFFLAKKYGMKLINLVANKKDQAVIERLSQKISWRIVLLFRILPGSNFGLLNYLFGITKIKYLPYIISTMIGVLPQIVLALYFFQRLIDHDSFMLISIIWILCMVLLPIFMNFFIERKAIS